MHEKVKVNRVHETIGTLREQKKTLLLFVSISLSVGLKGLSEGMKFYKF